MPEAKRLNVNAQLWQAKSIRTALALKPFSWFTTDGPHTCCDTNFVVGIGVAHDGVHIGVVVEDGRQPSSSHIPATYVEYFQL